MIMCDDQITSEAALEIGQELSHFPSLSRREFMSTIHSLYQETSCLDRIHTALSSSDYYAHMQHCRCSMTKLMLLYSPTRRQYQYMLHVTLSD